MKTMMKVMTQLCDKKKKYIHHIQFPSFHKLIWQARCSLLRKKLNSAIHDLIRGYNDVLWYYLFVMQTHHEVTLRDCLSEDREKLVLEICRCQHSGAKKWVGLVDTNWHLYRINKLHLPTQNCEQHTSVPMQFLLR